MHNSHRRSIETFSPVSRLGTRSCTTDPDPAIPSAVALGQKGKILSYEFSGGLTLRQVGTRIPLSPSLGLSQRAETALLNKSVEISTTAGRFCSRCHLYLSKYSRVSQSEPLRRVRAACRQYSRYAERAALLLRLPGSNKKAAYLFGQAAVSALITAFYLVNPRFALRRPVPDIHLIRSY